MSDQLPEITETAPVETFYVEDNGPIFAKLGAFTLANAAVGGLTVAAHVVVNKLAFRKTKKEIEALAQTVETLQAQVPQPQDTNESNSNGSTAV